MANMPAAPQSASTPPGQPFGLPISPSTMYLVIREGADAGHSFLLDRRIVRLGRSREQADIVLRKDPRISRRHATLISLPHPRGAHFIVIDEGSKNGILVNDDRAEVHCLSPGDTLRIGNTVLDFLSEEMLPADTDQVSLSPLMVDSDPDRLDWRKPGEVH